MHTLFLNTVNSVDTTIFKSLCCNLYLFLLIKTKRDCVFSSFFRVEKKNHCIFDNTDQYFIFACGREVLAGGETKWSRFKEQARLCLAVLVGGGTTWVLFLKYSEISHGKW